MSHGVRFHLLPLFLALVAVSAAQEPGAGSPTGFVTRIAAPLATCSAVSDELGLLVLGQKSQAEHHLSAFRLDAEGRPGAEPERIRLPLPASLQGLSVVPLGLAFHPRLPLLYVWQDVTAPAAGSAQAKAVPVDFDHLVVFDVTDGALQPRAAFARGGEFAFGQERGAIGISVAGDLLALPNLRDAAAVSKTDDGAAIGAYELGTNGLPVPVRVPIPGSLDGFGLSKFDMQVVVRMIHVGGFHPLPTGHGFFVPTRDTVLFSGYTGPGLWDTGNRSAELNYLYVANMVTCLIGGHRDIPVVYGARLDSGYLVAMRLAEGYPTLMPQVVIHSYRQFRSTPVVMTAPSPRLAIGGVNAVHVQPLGPDGMFVGTPTTIAVASPSVETLAYSDKHHRLYVPVEKTP